MESQKIIKALQDRKRFLESSLDQIEATLDTQPSKDFEDRATEREGDEVMERLGNAELLELKQINAALARHEQGTFGICVQCGGAVSAERLAIVPHAALCKDCAKRAQNDYRSFMRP